MKREKSIYQEPVVELHHQWFALLSTSLQEVDEIDDAFEEIN